MPKSNPITKSIRLNPDENNFLKQISREKGLSEAAVLKEFVRQGMAKYKLERAIVAYERGETDLSAAAKYAGVSIYHMMSELQKRDISPPAATEKFILGLKTLLETFGGSDALQRTIAELEERTT